MADLEYTTNGDYIVPGNWDAVYHQNEQATGQSIIKVVSIPSGATVTAGCQSDDAFLAYTDGSITEDIKITHGIGAVLMFRIAGVTATPVKLQVLPC